MTIGDQDHGAALRATTVQFTMIEAIGRLPVKPLIYLRAALSDCAIKIGHFCTVYPGPLHPMAMSGGISDPRTALISSAEKFCLAAPNPLRAR